MPRKHRIHYPGATYHVMLRGNDKQAISFNNSDRKRVAVTVRDANIPKIISLPR